MHFRLLRKLVMCFQLKFYEYHYYQMPLRNYKLTLHGLI